MKYLFTLIMLVILAACKGPANNNAANNNTADNSQVSHIIRYVNYIAVNNPGWDNNDVTKAEMKAKLSSSFNRDLQDSNLLEGVYFTLFDLRPSTKDSFIVNFESKTTASFDLNNLSTPTEVHVWISSTLPGSLARSLKTDVPYFITSYSKDKADSSYESDRILPDGNAKSHTISLCYLGTHTIHINKIAPVNGNN